MTWAGDIYRETSGDYSVHTTYSYLGSFTTISHRGRVIGYALDASDGKAKAEKHANGQGGIRS